MSKYLLTILALLTATSSSFGTETAAAAASSVSTESSSLESASPAPSAPSSPSGKYSTGTEQGRMNIRKDYEIAMQEYESAKTAVAALDSSSPKAIRVVALDRLENANAQYTKMERLYNKLKEKELTRVQSGNYSPKALKTMGVESAAVAGSGTLPSAQSELDRQGTPVTPKFAQLSGAPLKRKAAEPSAADIAALSQRRGALKQKIKEAGAELATVNQAIVQARFGAETSAPTPAVVTVGGE